MTDKAIPPCQTACPISTDVHGYVFAIARGDIDSAIRIIRQVNPVRDLSLNGVNPFPSACGRVCTRPCESACRRARL